jgi:hypothetical protein
MLCYRISFGVVDLDLYHEMSLFREALVHGRMPTTDVWAFTPTVAPLIHHEWGAGAVGYAFATTLGGPGILLLRYALGIAAFAVAACTAVRLGTDPKVVALLGVCAVTLVERGYVPVRAHAYSFLFTAIVIHIAERDRAGDRRALWLVAPLVVVWVNLHGGVVVGMMVLTAYLAELLLARKRCAHVVALLAAAPLLLAANPYGFRYHAYIVRGLLFDRHLITEWAPLWSSAVDTSLKWAFLSSLAFVVYGLAFGVGWRRSPGALVLVATAALAVRAHRMLPFYGLAWLSYCPALLHGSTLEQVVRSTLRRRTPVAAVVLGALATASAVLLYRAHPWLLRVPNHPDFRGALYYPVGAIHYLSQSNFRGKLLTDFDHGSYVAWKLHPAVKVSLDSRYEVAYPAAVAEEIIRAYQQGTGLTDLLAKYAPDALLVPRSSPLGNAVAWPAVYRDEAFVVYASPGSGLVPSRTPVSTSDVFP